MIGRNIRYCRIMAGKTEIELSREIGVSGERLEKYENGALLPELIIMRRIASVLGVTLAELMAVKSSGHKYEHHMRTGSYRQEYVKECIEEYLDRFFTVHEILGGKILREVPKVHGLKASFNAEEDALKLRRVLGFSPSGAIPNLTSALEEKGILIIPIRQEMEKFSTLHGTADSRPYIALNSRMTKERQRSRLAYELVHIFFEPQKVKDWERYTATVSGAFLFPQTDVLNELGEKRTSISPDMLIVSREYGISLEMLTRRAEAIGIIEEGICCRFNVKKHRQVSVDGEQALLFERLVLRAVSEGNMTRQRGAELLKIPYVKMNQKMSLSEWK